MSDFSALLADLVHYAHREMRVEYREFLEMRHGLEEDRRLNPGCLSRADFLGVENGLVVYRYHDGETRLRDEDDVTLIDLSTEAEVKKLKIAKIDVKNKKVAFKSLKSPPGAVAVLATPQRENFALKGSLEKIAVNPAAHPLVHAILTKAASPSRPRPSDPIGRIADLESGFLVVQGPPGAGKTYTGARAIVAMLAKNRRVGIMSQSHKAINGLLKEVAEVAVEKGVELRALKASSRERDELHAPGVTNVDGTEMVNGHKTASLVAGTIYQMSRLPDGALDVLIFDEAGQLSLAYALAASRGARAAVFLGDHRQLPHVSKAKHPGEAGTSLMAYLLGDQAIVPESHGIFLSETFRMNRDVTRLISSISYEGKLESHDSAAGRSLGLSDDPADPLGPASVVFLEVEHSGNEQSSPEEADAIAGLVKRLKKAKPDAECMVVAAYRAQENEIRARVGDLADVGTVDKFQGREADVVFYSLAASDPSAIPRDAGFLLSTNRLNVALSRAKVKAILVCCPKLLEVPPTSLETMALANALCKVRFYHRSLITRR